MVHSFLLIGQSNMAGRGVISEAELYTNESLKVLRNGRWQAMYVPVNPDREFSGRCLAESFADAYAKEHNVDVGLIPCADGGTTLDQWAPGGLLFDNAVFQASLAKRTSKIVGVLWHQGESDCTDELSILYEEKFLKIMQAFRDKLDLHNVPFILGGLGDMCEGRFKNYKEVNKTLQKIAREQKMVGYASADGLTSNDFDKIHFNTKSLIEFGLRYYSEFKRFEKDIILDDSEIVEDTKRTYLETL